MKLFLTHLFGFCIFSTLCIAAEPNTNQKSTTSNVRKESNNVEALVTEDLPMLVLKDKNREVEKYKFLGSWIIPEKTKWESVARPALAEDKSLIRVTTATSRLKGAPPRIITHGDGGLARDDVPWADSQISIIAFRAISEYPKSAILEIDTDGQVSAYNNGQFLNGLPGARPRDYDFRHYVPVALEKGSNIICLKVTSTNGPPRLRMAAILDRSKELQMAWGESRSLLGKKVIHTGTRGAAPVLKWNPLLDNLKVSVGVLDVLENKVVLKKNNMGNGGILRDGPKGLPPGLYKATYTTKSESAAEYFIVGSPRTAFEGLKRELEKLSVPSDGARLNIEAQMRRGEILFSRGNYDADDKNWQDKAVHTLGSLADMADMTRDKRENISKDIPGLHIRGSYSKADGSKQFYRLFIPSSYDPAQGVPLLVIMPTPVSDKNKPFIASPFMEANESTVLISKFAEKYGFAALWPGYRNAPEGLPCESAHTDEVIKAVENDYNIDTSKVSVYGNCGGGYFAGLLVSAYPRRFAAIVYDRAFFDHKPATLNTMPMALSSWHEALSPAERIIDNRQIRIFVFNDGSARPGHGDMEWTENFLEKAQTKRNDIKVHLGPPQDSSSGWNLVSHRWDMIFRSLAPCKNENYNERASGFLRKSGYQGPVSEIFATPFLVIRGTTAEASNAQINQVVEHIKKSYMQQFHGAEPIIKDDTEITEQEMKDYSLILVGNPESNAVWKKFEAQIPIKTRPSGLLIKDHEFFTNSAFLAIFEHPLNTERRILTIGSYDPATLGLVQKADACKATYDCRVFEVAGAKVQTHTIAKLNAAKE